jgi:Cys-tRNA(Pro)/Cys-tRNA(Cys) deacylase
MADQKTNVMRLLEQDGISVYPAYLSMGRQDRARRGDRGGILGLDPGQVFKTLVAVGASGGHYVFDIPVAESLDLKKAARAVGEKSIEMLHLKELFPLTGYVHGGCSPIGMKKPFSTVFDETCILYDTVCVSAG